MYKKGKKQLKAKAHSSWNGKHRTSPKIDPKGPAQEPVVATTAKFRKHGGAMDFSEGTPEEIAAEKLEEQQKLKAVKK